MITANLPVTRKQATVKFFHVNKPAVPAKLDQPVATPADRYTEAVVELEDICTINKLHGKAVCHALDNFNKSKGRKIALARAIAKLPKADRTAIWQTYFEAGVKVD